VPVDGPVVDPGQTDWVQFLAMRAPTSPGDRRCTRRGALVLGLLALSLGSCSATPQGPVVARVTLLDLSVSDNPKRGSTGLRSMGLASNSHTDRLTYYSTPRDEANLKIVDDEVMAGLLQALNKRGFEKRARSGQVNELDVKSLLVESGGETRVFGVRAGSSASDWKAMQAMTVEVLDVYNNTFGGQAMRSGLLPGENEVQQPAVVPLREVRAGGQ
jgi:hypothetical protein